MLGNLNSIKAASAAVASVGYLLGGAMPLKAAVPDYHTEQMMPELEKQELQNLQGSINEAVQSANKAYTLVTEANDLKVYLNNPDNQKNQIEFGAKATRFSEVYGEFLAELGVIKRVWRFVTDPSQKVKIQRLMKKDKEFQKYFKDFFSYMRDAHKDLLRIEKLLSKDILENYMIPPNGWEGEGYINS
jgi:hypothetical protein